MPEPIRHICAAKHMDGLLDGLPASYTSNNISNLNLRCEFYINNGACPHGTHRTDFNDGIPCKQRVAVSKRNHRFWNYIIRRMHRQEVKRFLNMDDHDDHELATKFNGTLEFIPRLLQHLREESKWL